MDYTITHLGGEHCVTGSCHLLQSRGVNIMVDCGLSQGGDLQRPFEDWPLHPSELDYLFLTHAHIDHVGMLPDLCRLGFSGEIICTHATKALIIPMIRDAVEFSHENRRDAHRIMGQVESLSWGFEYDVAFDLKKGIKFKLGNSGHILGSAFIAFKSGIDGWSITFSGDLGAKNTPILPDPSIPDPCDLLILESTYGDRLHEDRDNRLSNLGMLLSRALSDGGKVFIPSFSLGRTQELIYEMDRIFSDSELRKDFPDLNGESPVPVFIDSPLGLEITKIYATLFPFWDSEALRLRGEGDHPMDFRNLFGIMDLRAHISLLEMAGPAVVIAGSGMCTGGRIVAHLKKGLSDSRNDVLFVGYQGRGTPGRAIMRHGNKPGGYVCLDGEKVSINAGVHSLPGYSAHADQQELVDWVGSISGRPNRIKLVHGEDEPRKKLARQLALKGYDVMC